MADPVPSPVQLSRAPLHWRGWGSLYAALAHGTINTTAVRALLARRPLADGQAVYAVDVSVWAHCEAETSPQRGFYHHPSRHSAGQPIVAGWTYQQVCDDTQYGTVRVRAWPGLHPKVQRHAGRGSRGPAPIVPGTLVLVEVSRLPRETHDPQVLWLWWHGPEPPELGVIWRAYVRRFDLEHTFRFLKQTLGWTTPRVRQPEQADRWTWLILVAYTHLRLARTAAADRRLPWERPYPAERLTPCRVRRGVAALLLTLGTPACAPQPCGRSPGRPKGRRSGHAPRAPALKKAA